MDSFPRLSPQNLAKEQLRGWLYLLGNVWILVHHLEKSQKASKLSHFIVPVKKEIFGWASDSFTSGGGNLRLMSWWSWHLKGKREFSRGRVGVEPERGKTNMKSTNKENHCKLVNWADREFLPILNAEKCYINYKNSNYCRGCGVTGTLMFCWW